MAESERLPPTPSTLKQLFAYSGNQCAIPDCKELLVDPSGTLLGKVAHICAAEKEGPRYDRNMTPEGRRSFANLMVVCGKHHDLIDDKKNLAKYPVEMLQKYKREHEARFKKAERQLLQQFHDTTQATQPTYPTHLKRLSQAYNEPAIHRCQGDIDGIRKFIDKLKEVPLEQRGFAIKLAERMLRNQASKLPVEDVKGAFQIDAKALKRNMSVLKHHSLGGFEDDVMGQYFVCLYERDPGGNPFEEIVRFCRATDHTSDELIYDLNFALYD